MTMRIAVFILLNLLVFSRVSPAAIEIYSDGKRFNSFEEYQKTEQPSVGKPELPHINSALDIGIQKINKMSYNNGVHHVLVSFDQNWQNPRPRFIVGADELEYAIQESMQNQHGATLLISDPKRLRIMSYNPQNNLSFQAKMESIDKTVKK